MPPAAHPKRPEAVALLRQGKTPAEVKEATGLSLRAIYKYAEQEKIPAGHQHPPRPDLRTERSDDLAAALLGNPDAPAAQVGALFGVSGQYARQVRAMLTDEDERKE